MEQYFGKKYKSTKNGENMDEYMKLIGVGLVNRNIAKTLSPTAVLTRNEDDSYVFTISTSIKDVSLTFRLGEEFDEDRIDGTKVKTVITFEGDSMIQIQTDPNGRKSKHVRTFSPDKMTLTTTMKGWDKKVVRTYDLVK